MLQHVCSVRKLIVLDTFVETLNGFCKDGLNGTQDYRIFLPIFMFLTILGSITWAVTTGHFVFGQLVLIASFGMIVSPLVAYFQPCKEGK